MTSQANAFTAQPLEQTSECLHELFLNTASAGPGRVALRHGRTRIRFGELAEQAGSLAALLASRGVGPETRVVLLLDDPVNEIRGALAVMIAGGAFVAIDSDQPVARMRLMLEAAAPVLALVDGDRHAELVGAERTLDLRAPGPEPAPPPTRRVPPGALAAVTFTSGSSGHPKGVAVEHRQLVNYVRGATRSLRLDDVDSVAALSRLSTDLGHTAVFGGLCNGATVHLIPPELTRDPVALGGYFEFHGVDLLKVLPEHLQALCTADLLAVRPRRALVLGGAPPDPGFLARLLEAEVPYDIYNHYGPTECAVGVMTHHVRHAADAPVPLDTALSGNSIYVLDGALQPAEEGEVFISGANVCRGYLGDPAQTALRFVPDPLAPQPGTRMYRTGDRAQRTGALLTLAGRADRQVKIRGHRIELDEVAHALRSIDGVREAHVEALPAAGGGVQIGAFLALDGIGRDAVVDGCAQRLPEPMCPVRWCVLENLPRLPGGKVDAQALRLLEQPESDAPATPAPPRNVYQRLVWGIWRDVLESSDFGLDDNFFDVGGDSIKMIRVYARLRAAVTTEFELIELFSHPSVRSLADRIAGMEPHTAAPGKDRAALRRRLSENRP